MTRMILSILGFIFPSYGYQRRLQEFDYKDSLARAKWYEECYIPWVTEIWPEIVRKQFREKPLWQEFGEIIKKEANIAS